MEGFGKTSERNKLTVSIILFSTHEVEQSNLIRLECSTSWVETKIIDTVNLLSSDIFPKPSLNCEHCNYLKKRWQLSIT